MSGFHSSCSAFSLSPYSSSPWSSPFLLASWLRSFLQLSWSLLRSLWFSLPPSSQPWEQASSSSGGLGGYYIVKWFNQSEGTAPDGSAIGDKLNNLTGGRMSFLMDGMRKQDAEGGHKDVQDKDAQGPRRADDDRKDGKEKEAQTSARSPISSGPRKLNREHIKNGVGKQLIPTM
ncbi:hypothetical protein HDK77DRAFT_432090 [Phyllosticta capitalensis]